MTEGNGHHKQFAQTSPAQGRRRTPWPLAVVAALFVIVPFLAWYGTWFGRSLNDTEIENYLNDEANPRHEQHALSQIVERMKKGEDARRWYPQVVALASSQHADVRMTAAWAMGGDAKSAEFHAALLRLLADNEPIVRRNAALALVSFNDARSRAELTAMLRPYTFNAPIAGQLVSVLPINTSVKREAMLARVKLASDQLVEIRSPLPGRIEQLAVAPDAQVTQGQPLLTLAPDADSALDALVALRFVGAQEDLPEVERYASGVAGMPEEIKKEAALTAEAIKRRAEQHRTN
ncbi:MAG TPA: HEAT repeat domain-containing protein [Pyrinomonadaceae bacterium]|nr:HEAT repeat domain-containing protein [Pyrinomonadaceae bacterium]